MNENLRVDGVFDSETYKFFEKLLVKHFVFDFRPLSTNFVQQYRFMEILDSVQVENVNFYLKYENEKEFVIQKHLEDIKSLFKENKKNLKLNLFLEFSDRLELEFYEQFNIPYLIHYFEKSNLKKKINSHLLEGIVLNGPYIISLMEKLGQKQFVQLFYQTINDKIKHSNFKIFLTDLEESSNINLLAQLFEIDCFSFVINDQVQSSFRIIDPNKLREKYYHFQQFLQNKL